MSNGCICCTLREDLLVVRELAQDGRFDYLLIESSGISSRCRRKPTFEDEKGESLSQFAWLDNGDRWSTGCIQQYQQAQSLQEAGHGRDDLRSVAGSAD